MKGRGENKVTTDDTTCQICSRVIKSADGSIAAHGYRRPFRGGYQSASCPGSGHPSFQISRDRLGREIDAVSIYSARLAVEAKDLEGLDRREHLSDIEGLEAAVVAMKIRFYSWEAVEVVAAPKVDRSAPKVRKARPVLAICADCGVAIYKKADAKKGLCTDCAYDFGHLRDALGAVKYWLFEVTYADEANALHCARVSADRLAEVAKRRADWTFTTYDEALAVFDALKVARKAAQRIGA